MAAVNADAPRFVSPAGYEVFDKVELSGDVEAGETLKYTGAMSNGQAVVQKCPAGSAPDGIAVKDGYDGQRGFDMAVQGEIDGYSGLTPGAQLYQSGASAGALDDADGGGSNPEIPVKAVTETRIRFNFV